MSDVIINNFSTTSGLEKELSNGLYVRFGKRALDFIGASSVLILLSPVLLFAMLLVRFKLGSPIFFKQTRLGKGEKEFTILKLRTMNNRRDSSGKLLPDSQRTPFIGKLIRRLSIDELPQLFNVLKGEMSLIGPRPLYPTYLNFYSSRERLRHLVRPGMTGLAQVNGRNSTTWDRRLELDSTYVETLSFTLDMSIAFKTICKVIKSDELESGAVTSIGMLSDERAKKA